MRIITPAQCRAARALLNWSQPDLAERCAVHVQTISNFEKEASTPSKTTLEKISGVLDHAGIELTEDDGLRRKAQHVQTLQGAEGFRIFMDDVYETARTVGGELRLFNARPSNWVKWLGEDWWPFHAARMEEHRGNFTFNITTRKGETNFISHKFAEYRWVPDNIWNQHSYYAYGDKIAFLNFDNGDVNIFVLKHAHFAKTHKFLFDVIWNQYSILPDVPGYKPCERK